MKIFRLAAAALLATSAVPALAQGEVALDAGATVYDPQGGTVGTIQQVSGSVVVLDTGDNLATIGADSFVAGENGPVIGYTKAQLDEAVEAARREQEAKLTAAIAVGAELRSNDGKPVGTIQAINEDGSVVVEQDDRSFALQRSQLGTDGEGLIMLFSAAQLEAALSGSGG